MAMCVAESIVLKKYQLMVKNENMRERSQRETQIVICL